jgi:hypothetical protein
MGSLGEIRKVREKRVVEIGMFQDHADNVVMQMVLRRQFRVVLPKRTEQFVPFPGLLALRDTVRCAFHSSRIL